MVSETISNLLMICINRPPLELPEPKNMLFHGSEMEAEGHWQKPRAQGRIKPVWSPKLEPVWGSTRAALGLKKGRKGRCQRKKIVSKIFSIVSIGLYLN